jgi:hypothetical protein
MFRNDSGPADDRIRAARAAVAERTRLLKLRQGLVEEIVAAERRHADAEPDDVGARAIRDHLAGRVVELDRRLEALSGADAELATACDAKRQLLAGSETPAGRELEGITEQLGECDAEAKAVDEAIAAGDEVRGDLARFVATTTGVIDHAKLRKARVLLGQVEARLAVFQRELLDVGSTLEVDLGELPEPRSWWHGLTDTFTDPATIAIPQNPGWVRAHATLDRVDATLRGLRRRRKDLAGRIGELERMAADVIEPR